MIRARQLRSLLALVSWIAVGEVVMDIEGAQETILVVIVVFLVKKPAKLIQRRLLCR